MRRFLLTSLLAVAVVAVTASPAMADAAGPTHYDSVVTGVQPSGDGVPVDFEVLGGDAFLVVRAEPGTVVEVPGYEGEPYVRIDADGAVHVNERSEARWVNDERYGVSPDELPGLVDTEAPPTWVHVANDGEYAWHDHRIHYMSPSLPRQVDPDADEPQDVWDWSVPVVVDGQDLEVTGTLTWLPSPSPAVPIGLVAVFSVLAVAAVLRWRAALVPVVAVAVVAMAAIGVVRLTGVPPGADTEPGLLALPLIAAGALGGGSLLARRRPAAAAIVPAVGIPVLVWGILQSGALTRPIVPGTVDVVVVRVVVAWTIAVGIASVLATGRRLLAQTAIATGIAADEDRDTAQA